uniref:RRM domain-containing protein n=1 Tax=Graphocephala atropunctata TaxID=36148 RepID=A0A1B6MG94_9HEMI
MNHISLAKKHILKQEYYDKVNKAVFVVGVSKLTENDLKRIFQKYGEVSHITKQTGQSYAFVQFVDKLSIEKVLKARIFVGKSLLFIHKYEDRNKPSSRDEKSRKHSDISSNTSQSELEPGQVGVEELPVELSDSSDLLWSDPQSVFESQVQRFISQVEMSAEMYYHLNQVIRDVEELFCKMLPGCKVIVFGSCGSTLAFKNSDVDLFIQCVGDQPKEFVKKEAKAMYRSRLFSMKARIPSARVPIVKFEHIKTGWQCDLTADSKLGVCNSRLIRFLISLDPRIRPLVMVVKYWAKVCGVTGHPQNLTTYSLVMLVIFYLQQSSPSLLPPVATLQRLADLQEFSNGWECGFCDDQQKLLSEWSTEENKQTLKDLLMGFFQFYDTYDFNNVVCPLLGHSVPVADFEDSEKLPVEMQLYKDNIRNDPKLEFRRNVMLKVQDPFEQCLNITRNVSDRSFFIFKKACSVSCELGHNSDNDSMLTNLFSVDKKSLDVCGDNFKMHIPFKNSKTDQSSSLTEDVLSQWYEMTTEAILLVMREVMKFSVEPINVEVSNKVKKLESSLDVHTLPKNFGSSDDLNYICSGLSSVWISRRKTSKLLNSLNISLNDFEKEVCISNVLYKPKENSIVSFSLVMSSFDQFKTTTKGINIIINDKESQEKSQIKEVMHYFKCYLRFHIRQALGFITKTKESSSVTEVKESLKELFKLTQTTLSVLSNNFDEFQDNKDHRSTKEKGEGILRQQSLLLKGITKEEPIHEEQNDSVLISKNNSEGGNPLSKSVEPVAYPTLEAPLTSIDNAKTKEIRNSNLSAENITKRKVRTKVDSFLEANNPDRMNVVNNIECVNITDSLVSNTILNLKQCETGSFISDKKNPFLESIEKLTVEPIFTQNKSKFCSDLVKIPEKDNGVEKTSKSDLDCSVNKQGNKIKNADMLNNPLSKNRGENSNITLTAPKVFVERPHRYSNLNNYKQPHSNTHKVKDDLGGVYRRRGSGPHRQDAFSRVTNHANSSNNYEFYSEYVDRRYNHEEYYNSDKRQRQLSLSVEKQKIWYPTLFKNHQ